MALTTLPKKDGCKSPKKLMKRPSECFDNSTCTVLGRLLLRCCARPRWHAHDSNTLRQYAAPQASTADAQRPRLFRQPVSDNDAGISRPAPGNKPAIRWQCLSR